MNCLAQKLNQKGQSLVIALMLMAIALFIGVTVSSRFVKSMRSLTASDNVSRATAVAEAAVERILLKPSSTLENYISNNNCGSDCLVSISDGAGQTLTANITLSFVGNTTNPYPITLPDDESAAVTLTGYPTGRTISVCWNGTTSITGLYIYTQSGVTKATPLAYNAVLAQNIANGFSSSAAAYGYANCFNVTTSQTPQALRLRSVYGRTDAYIVPEGGYSVPIQGIQITSVGKAGSATKKVTVIKSKPFAPAYFDYALYQKSEVTPLSN